MDGAPVLETSELAYVVVRLEQAVKETAEGFRRGMTMLVALFGFMGVIAVMQGSYGILVIVVPFIGFFFFSATRRARRPRPRR